MCLGLWSKSVSIMCELIVILARQRCGHSLENQLVVRPVGFASINISTSRASAQSRKLLWCLRDDLQVNEVERNSSRFFILSCVIWKYGIKVFSKYYINKDRKFYGYFTKIFIYCKFTSWFPITHRNPPFSFSLFHVEALWVLGTKSQRKWRTNLI